MSAAASEGPLESASPSDHEIDLELLGLSLHLERESSRTDFADALRRAAYALMDAAAAYARGAAK